MPNVSDEDILAAQGVTRVQWIVESELAWIYRRIEHRDVGIDAEVEIVLWGQSTGWIVALQIKTGSSFFRERTKNGWKFRGDYDHLRYWRSHNLAVAVVLVDPTNWTAYWAPVGDQVHEAGQSWTIEVPSSNVLGPDSITELRSLGWARDPLSGLFRYLSLHREHIRFIHQGGKVVLEFEDMINKTRGEGTIRIIHCMPDETGNLVDHLKEERTLIRPMTIYEEFVRQLFPWAEFAMDDDEEDDEDVEEEYFFGGELRASDLDGDDEDDPDEIRPYTVEEGELARYRLRLSLGPLGRAFSLIMDASAKGPPPVLEARAIALGP